MGRMKEFIGKLFARPFAPVLCVLCGEVVGYSGNRVIDGVPPVPCAIVCVKCKGAIDKEEV